MAIMAVVYGIWSGFKNSWEWFVFELSATSHQFLRSSFHCEFVNSEAR